MRVLLSNILCEKGDHQANLAKHLRYLELAADHGCHMAVFPEMSLSGYIDPSVDAALNVNDEVVQALVDATARRDVHALFGIAEKNGNDKPLISQVHAGNGRILGVYTKQHIAGDEAGHFTSTPCKFSGECAGMRFGVIICADYEVNFPIDHSAADVQLVFHCSAPGLYGERRRTDADWQRGMDWWKQSSIEKHAQHAVRNDVYIAQSTQAGATRDEDFPGWAGVFAPDGSLLECTRDWRESHLIVELPR